MDVGFDMVLPNPKKSKILGRSGSNTNTTILNAIPPNNKVSQTKTGNASFNLSQNTFSRLSSAADRAEVPQPTSHNDTMAHNFAGTNPNM